MTQIYRNSRQQDVQWRSTSEALAGLALLFDRNARRPDITAFDRVLMKDLSRRLVSMTYGVGSVLDQMPRTMAALPIATVRESIAQSDRCEDRATWGWGATTQYQLTIAQVLRSAVMTATSLDHRFAEAISDTDRDAIDMISDFFVLNWQNPVMRVQLVGKQRAVAEPSSTLNHRGMDEPGPTPGM